jgi:nitroreductase
MTDAPNDAIHLLKTRRSIVARDMGQDGPSTEQLDDILRAGLRVPDHGKLAPWRFIVFEGTSRVQFGGVLERAYLASGMPDEDDRRQFERERFLRAGAVVAVISIVNPESKIPEWEQILSSGAVCQNMLVAAAAHGLAAQWLTEWYAYDDMVRQALRLHENERVAGFMYFGSVVNVPSERVRPEFEDKVSRWRPEL